MLMLILLVNMCWDEPSSSIQSMVLQHMKRLGCISCFTQPVPRKHKPASLSLGAHYFWSFRVNHPPSAGCHSLLHVMWKQWSQNLSSILMVSDSILHLWLVNCLLGSQCFVCSWCFRSVLWLAQTLWTGHLSVWRIGIYYHPLSSSCSLRF